MIFSKVDYNKQYFDNKYLIISHTPTRLIKAKLQGLPMESIMKEEKHEYDKIIKMNIVLISFQLRRRD